MVSFHPEISVQHIDTAYYVESKNTPSPSLAVNLIIHWQTHRIDWIDSTLSTHPKSFVFKEIKEKADGSLECTNAGGLTLYLHLLTREVFQKYVGWPIPSEALQSDETLRGWCSEFVREQG